MADDLCPHGWYPEDCRECLRLCPHDLPEMSCSDCSWDSEGAARRDLGEAEQIVGRDVFDRALEFEDQESEVIRRRDELSVALRRRWNEEEAERRRRRTLILNALERSLRRHGTPLHWTRLRRMAGDELDFKLGPVETYRALSDHPERFARCGDGVYQLARKASKS